MVYRGRTLFVIAAAAALSLTACGQGSVSGDQTAEPEETTQATAGGDLTAVEVGVIPIVDVAPIYLGEKEGIFEKHGLDLTLTQAQGGAAIVPAVKSGQMDFGFSNVTSLAIARSNGLDMRMVAPGGQTTGNPDEDFAFVLVPEDSEAQTASDLEGKRVAVNTLNNINDTVISEGVRQDGGDPENIRYVELAFPDMLAQLEAGNVDAIGAVEPYATMAKEAGMRPVLAQYAEPIEDLLVAGYFTNDEMIESDPDTVRAFAEAMKESQEYAQDNPEETRAVISEYTSIDDELLKQITLARFPGELHPESTERILEISRESGLIGDSVTVEDLIYKAD